MSVTPGEPQVSELRAGIMLDRVKEGWMLQVNSNESKAVTMPKSVSHTRSLQPVRRFRRARLRLSSQSANLFHSRGACSIKSLKVHLGGQLEQLEKALTGAEAENMHSLQSKEKL
ncbi:hypothetical protein KOW79_016243 [Hemibagrus wyckioides]|uniref:Uncharacterized protein n=1 Tax=Hemibagrus wyckioides TaxID=337641 RepID=A0A9D3SE57_9TELE|nr:hypothetical protein KOW79_016243 [Hemibagrus wyckioides]